MRSFRNELQAVVEREEIPLIALSEELQISIQTLLRWVDRRVIDGSVRWTLTDDNEERRLIEIRKNKREEINAFAEEYRKSAVTHKEAGRILKRIDRKRIKRLVRTGQLEAVEVDETTMVLVGSIEDYLMDHEKAWHEA